MTVEMHLGELLSPAIPPGAVGTKTCGHARRECSAASLASFFVLMTNGACAAKVIVPLITELKNHCAAIPLFGAADATHHNLASSVRSIVLKSSHYFQVFGTIVKRVAILVVNNLLRRQWAAKLFFHNYAVLITSLIVAPYLRRENDVVMTNRLAILVVWVFGTDPMSLVHNINYNTVLQRGQVTS